MIRFITSIMPEYYAYHRSADGSDPIFSCFDTEDYDLQIWCCLSWGNPVKQDDEELDDWAAAKEVCQATKDDDDEVWMCDKSEFLNTKPETGNFAWTRDQCDSEAFTIVDKSSVNDDTDDDDGESAIDFGTTDLDSLIIGVIAGILLMVIIMVCCILSSRRKKRLAEENGVEMSTRELNKMDTADIRSPSVHAANDKDVDAEDGGQAGTETVVNVQTADTE